MNPGEKFGGGEPPLENLSSWQRKSHYERLGISPEASKEEAKKAYRKLTLKYHPDRVSQLKNENLSKNYEEVYKLISEAYEAVENGTASTYSRTETTHTTNTGGFNKQNTSEKTTSSEPGNKKKPWDFEDNSQENFGGSTWEEVWENIKNGKNPFGKRDFSKEKKTESDFSNQGRDYSNFNYSRKQEQKVFNEQEEINNFVNYAKQNSSYEFQIAGIREKLEDLMKQGVSKEKLLNAVKQHIFLNFRSHTEKNSSYEFQIESVQQHMGELIRLGYKKEELLAHVEPVVTANFVSFVQKNSSYDFQIEGVATHLNALTLLGLSKEKLLQKIQPILLSEFEKFTQKNSSYTFQLEGVTQFLEALARLGIDRRTLSGIFEKYKSKAR